MKYGFIGCGNMGGALARALTQTTKDLIISDPSPAAQRFAEELGCAYGTNEQVVQCDRIFLAVKPNIVESVLTALAPALTQRKPLLISMAAGVKIEKLQGWAGTDLPIIRIMPNTPAAVGKGMITYDTNAQVTPELLADFLQDMAMAGTFDALPEKLMDVATAVAGCGPAYMYMMIEAMADGAVVCGLPRDKAMRYAAATMAGAAEMVLRTGQHPGTLKDAVCSPGGSTIAGVQTLEQHGFRGTVIDCVTDAYRRTQELG
ncbi:MAG: pyrroline-5-carboxylate reductase [Ruminococcaceae bacterium]|nr:pyrroline-5-carboxylate reductase [Oscillospiraceae bacterium]